MNEQRIFRPYTTWSNYINNELVSISFECSYRKRPIALIVCKEKTLYLRPVKIGVKARDRILKIQEVIKKDYPDYKLGELAY